MVIPSVLPFRGNSRKPDCYRGSIIVSIRTFKERTGYGDSWVHSVANQKDDEIKILRQKLQEAQSEIERLQESVKNYRTKYIQAAVKNESKPTRSPAAVQEVP